MPEPLAPEIVDRLRKSARRWKALALSLLVGLGLVTVLGIGGTAVSVGQAQRARQEAEAARQQAEEAKLYWSDQVEGQSARRLAEGVTTFDPSVGILLKESAQNDREHKSQFFAALSVLAQKHGSSLEDFSGQQGLTEVDEGYAVFFRQDEKKYVVAVLRGDDGCIPGEDTQFLLLLSDAGRLLDRLSCRISNRLTRMFVDYSGVFRTEVPDWAADGGQLVVRYIPEDGSSVSGNWSHGITHAGKTYHFPWSKDLLSKVPSAEWDKKGLCRVAIRDGKLAVLFPKLEAVIAEG
jgi:hypothetical protein